MAVKSRASEAGRGECPNLRVVVSVPCADFEPQARRYSKLGHDPREGSGLLSLEGRVAGGI
jgi:hypothetical protein